MKKIIILLMCLVACVPLLQAQSKIAIFDPDGDVPVNIKTIVREEISSIIVSNKDYYVLERTLIDKVLEETKFQSAGYVDESQLGKLGQMMGADYVCAITIIKNGNTYHITCKQIDVRTSVLEGLGRGETTNASQIYVAAQDAAIKFASDPNAMKKEMDKRKREEAEKQKEEAKKQQEAAERGRKEQEKYDEQRRKEQERYDEQQRKERAREARRYGRQVTRQKYTYFALGAGNGITYGKAIGFGIGGRLGGALGIGLQAGLGSGYEDGKSYLHYSAGAKIYPYKMLFFSAHYGIITAQKTEASVTDDGHWSMEGEKIYSGLSFLGGLDIRFENIVITLGGGVSSIDNKKWVPAWDVGLSFAFN